MTTARLRNGARRSSTGPARKGKPYMADDIAVTQIVFDATQAKKGAEDTAQAAQKIISVNDAVVASEGKVATAIEAATARKTTARQAAAQAAATATSAAVTAAAQEA